MHCGVLARQTTMEQMASGHLDLPSWGSTSRWRGCRHWKACWGYQSGSFLLSMVELCGFNGRTNCFFKEYLGRYLVLERRTITTTSHDLRRRTRAIPTGATIIIVRYLFPKNKHRQCDLGYSSLATDLCLLLYLQRLLSNMTAELMIDMPLSHIYHV